MRATVRGRRRRGRCSRCQAQRTRDPMGGRSAVMSSPPRSPSACCCCSGAARSVARASRPTGTPSSHTRGATGASRRRSLCLPGDTFDFGASTAVAADRQGVPRPLGTVPPQEPASRSRLDVTSHVMRPPAMTAPTERPEVGLAHVVASPGSLIFNPYSSATCCTNSGQSSRLVMSWS